MDSALTFSFGEVEAALARLNDIASEKRVAFAGRLRVLQKCGVPMRGTPGRGKQGAFTLDHVFQMAFGVELLQCGLPPQRVGEIIRRDWWLKRDEMLALLHLLQGMTLDENGERRSPRGQEVVIPWVWTILIQELSELAKTDLLAKQRIRALRLDQFSPFAKMSFGSAGGTPRMIVINPGRIVSGVVSGLNKLRFNLDAFIRDYAEIEEGLTKVSERLLEIIDADRDHAIDIGDNFDDLKTWVAERDVGNSPIEELHPIFRLFIISITARDDAQLTQLAHTLQLYRRLGDDDGAKRHRLTVQLASLLGRLGLATDAGQRCDDGSALIVLTPKGEDFFVRWAELWEIG